MQIAAKINPSGTSESAGQKRPLEDGSGMDWLSKCFHRPSLRTADITLAIVWNWPVWKHLRHYSDAL